MATKGILEFAKKQESILDPNAPTPGILSAAKVATPGILESAVEATATPGIIEEAKTSRPAIPEPTVGLEGPEVAPGLIWTPPVPKETQIVTPESILQTYEGIKQTIKEGPQIDAQVRAAANDIILTNHFPELKEAKKRQDAAARYAPMIGMAFQAPIIMAGYLALDEAKTILNAVIKKEKFDPLETKMLYELLPEDTPPVTKTVVGAAEWMADIFFMRAAANLAKQGLIKGTLKTLLKKAVESGMGPKDIGKLDRARVKEFAKGTTLEAEAKRLMKARSLDLTKGQAKITGAAEAKAPPGAVKKTPTGKPPISGITGDIIFTPPKPAPPKDIIRVPEPPTDKPAGIPGDLEVEKLPELDNIVFDPGVVSEAELKKIPKPAAAKPEAPEAAAPAKEPGVELGLGVNEAAELKRDQRIEGLNVAIVRMDHRPDEKWHVMVDLEGITRGNYGETSFIFKTKPTVGMLKDEMQKFFKERLGEIDEEIDISATTERRKELTQIKSDLEKLAKGLPIKAAAPEKKPEVKPIKVETDHAKIQEIKNTILEEELILKTGKFNNRKFTEEELTKVRESLARNKQRIGEKLPSHLQKIVDKQKGHKIETITSDEIFAKSEELKKASQEVKKVIPEVREEKLQDELFKAETAPKGPETPGSTIILNPEDVGVLPEELQLRDTPYSQETVASILDSGWDDSLYDQVKIFKRDGKWFAAGDGHSRLAGWNALKKAGKPVPETLDFRVVTEAEAKKLRFANLKRTQLKPMEEMKAFKEMVATGKSTNSIAKEFGIKTSYVESVLSLGNLAPDLQDFVRQGMFNINQAYVLGSAVETYGITNDLQQEIFHKMIKVQDITAAQLRTFLDNFAPAMTEQISLGLTGVQVSKGAMGVLNEALAVIKKAEMDMQPYNSVFKNIAKIEKRKGTVPPEMKKVKDIAEKQVKKYQEEINTLVKKMGRDRPAPPDIKLKEPEAPYYQMNLDKEWELVKPVKPKITKQDQDSLWTNLAQPKFDLPPQKAKAEIKKIKQPKQKEISFQVKDKNPPDIIEDTVVTEGLEQVDVMPATSLRIEKYEDIVDIFYGLKTEVREHSYVISRDMNDNILGVNLISIGSLNVNILHPREAFRIPQKLGAKKVSFIHNHPSGNPEASEDDVTITKRLVATGDVLGIQATEHIIIDHDEFGVISSGGRISRVLPYQEPAKRPEKVKVFNVRNNKDYSKGPVGKIIQGPMDAIDVIKSFTGKDTSTTMAIMMSSKNQVQVVIPLPAGAEAAVHAKQIMIAAMDKASASVVFITDSKRELHLSSLLGQMRTFSIDLLDIVIYNKKNPDESYSLKESGEFPEPPGTLRETGPPYLREPTNKFSLIKSIARLRRRIGIPDDKYDNIKLAITGSTDLNIADTDQLAQFRKVLNALRTKQVKQAITAPKKEFIPEAEIKKDFVPAPISQKKKDAMKRAKDLESVLKLPEKEYEQLRIQTAGWADTRQMTAEDVKKYNLRLLQKKLRIDQSKIVESTATKIGLIYLNEDGRPVTAQYRRFIKNYFQKFPKDLNLEELKRAKDFMDQLQIDYRGKVTVPQSTRGLLIPQHRPLLETYTVGIDRHIYETYEYLKLQDITTVVKNIKELTALTKEGAITTQKAVQLAKDILPLQGNDLRVLDKFGLHKSIGKPLQDAGVEFRRLDIEGNRKLERWKKAADETKEGREVMFNAVDGPLTPEIREQLTENQLKAVHEWQEEAQKYIEVFDIQDPQQHYIHHMLEGAWRELANDKYPFPRELAAVIEHIIPESLYAGFLKQRIGFPFIKRDFVAATAAYIKIANRKIAYDPALKGVNQQLRILKLNNPKLANFIKEFIQINLLGRVTGQARDIATSINHYGEIFGEKTIQLPEEVQKQAEAMHLVLPGEWSKPRVNIQPRDIDKAISDLKMANYLSVIAMNISTGITNLTQPMLAVGKMRAPALKRLMILLHSELYAFRAIFSKKTWKALEDRGILEEMNRFMETDNRARDVMEQFLSWSMVNMKYTEFINRVTVSKMGAEYKHWLARKGHIPQSELDKEIEANPKLLQDAQYLDKDFSDMVNYNYGADYTPPGFMTPVGRLIYHLSSFGLKYMNRMVMFAKEAQLGETIKKFNKVIADNGNGKGPDMDEEFIKFVDGLPPQTRKNFIAYLIMATGIGVIFGDPLYFTFKSIGVNIVNPISKIVIATLSGDIDRVPKMIWDSFIPFKSAIRKVAKVAEFGIKGAYYKRPIDDPVDRPQTRGSDTRRRVGSGRTRGTSQRR